MSHAGRPQGKTNFKPSKSAINGYYELLKSAADAGDTQAAGFLVMNDTVSQHLEQSRSDRLEREAEKTGGNVSEVIGRQRRRMMDAIDQIDDQPRDAAGQ